MVLSCLEGPKGNLIAGLGPRTERLSVIARILEISARHLQSLEGWAVNCDSIRFLAE